MEKGFIKHEVGVNGGDICHVHAPWLEPSDKSTKCYQGELVCDECMEKIKTV
jgi:hypothetical protein